jgi:hypothetical protein
MANYFGPDGKEVTYEKYMALARNRPAPGDSDDEFSRVTSDMWGPFIDGLLNCFGAATRGSVNIEKCFRDAAKKNQEWVDRQARGNNLYER